MALQSCGLMIVHISGVSCDKASICVAVYAFSLCICLFFRNSNGIIKSSIESLTNCLVGVWVEDSAAVKYRLKGGF